MNLPSALVTCPDFDLMTRYLSAWAHMLVEEFGAKGHEIYELKESQVTKKKFRGMLAKTKPSVLFINGHGNARQVAGQDQEIILDESSAALLAGTKVYAVSCQSAKILGKTAVQRGAKAYIGYSEDFILVSQPNKMRRPTEDSTAALFLEPSNHIIRSVLKGHGAQAAAEKGRQAYTKSISTALNSDVQSDNDKYIPFLLWNRQWLVAHEQNK